MCGIFGYVGSERSVPQTVGAALRSLEYRGYDSWGMAWRVPDGIASVKRAGRVPGSFTFEATSRIAIGHTRWATHGGVTDANAHPHSDPGGRVAVVHNGIVENAQQLRASLAPPSTFTSETDSEVIAHLLGERVREGMSIVDAMRDVFPLLQGQNAVIAIDRTEETIAAAMNVSPLVVGLGANGEGAFIASDPFALAGKAARMIVAPHEAVISLGPDGVSAVSFGGTAVPLPDSHPVPDATIDELDGHRHFMAKEMAEQPKVLAALIADEAPTRLLADLIALASRVVLTGCGSASFASRLGAGWLATQAGRQAMAVPASEFGEIRPFLDDKTLVIAVTQSGETADLLDAMRAARESGSHVVALVNVEHSSAARFADCVVPLLAGRERSVLATKSMLAMLARLLATTGHIAGAATVTQESLAVAARVIRELDHEQPFQRFVQRTAGTIAGSEHVYVVGKGLGVAVAQEAALKIKEASYVHAEAFAAGELKHGAIALIEEGTPCLVFGTDDYFRTDTASSAQELRSRGGYTIGIGLERGEGIHDSLVLPDAGLANALIHVYVAQQLAYRTAVLRNLDPDFPRNLAKSVTVR